MSQVVVKDIHSTTLSSEKFVLPVIGFLPPSNSGVVGGMLLVSGVSPSSDGVYVRTLDGWRQIAFTM